MAEDKKTDDQTIVYDRADGHSEINVHYLECFTAPKEFKNTNFLLRYGRFHPYTLPDGKTQWREYFLGSIQFSPEFFYRAVRNLILEAINWESKWGALPQRVRKERQKDGTVKDVDYLELILELISQLKT